MLGKMWKEAEVACLRRISIIPLDKSRETGNIVVGIIDIQDDFRIHDQPKYEGKLLAATPVTFHSHERTDDSVLCIIPIRRGSITVEM
jgi:hypothetical protein